MIFWKISAITVLLDWFLRPEEMDKGLSCPIYWGRPKSSLRRCVLGCPATPAHVFSGPARSALHWSSP